MKEDLVYILVLNYNGYEDTIECVDSLFNIHYKNYKIVIIDNNSTDNSLYEVEKRYSNNNNIYILKLDTNFGYAAGNNRGIEFALKNNARYICVLNNDVSVEPDFLNVLIENYKKDSNMGVIGPAICEYSDKSIIQSTGAYINLKKGAVPPLNSGVKINNIKDENICCDYVGGACMLFDSNIINEFGYIPENYFLFFEETEWCYRIRRSGKKVICNTKAKVYHKGSISINKIGGLSKYFMERNLVVFVKRNSSISEKLYFYIYLSLRTIKRIIVGKEPFSIIKNYYDGMFNRIDKRFSFVYINDK